MLEKLGMYFPRKVSEKEVSITEAKFEIGRQENLVFIEMYLSGKYHTPDFYLRNLSETCTPEEAVEKLERIQRHFPQISHVSDELISLGGYEIHRIKVTV